jgi:hypothetical protein
MSSTEVEAFEKTDKGVVKVQTKAAVFCDQTTEVEAFKNTDNGVVKVETKAAVLCDQKMIVAVFVTVSALLLMPVVVLGGFDASKKTATTGITVSTTTVIYIIIWLSPYVLSLSPPKPAGLIPPNCCVARLRCKVALQSCVARLRCKVALQGCVIVALQSCVIVA